MVCKNCGANVGKEYRLCPYCMSELKYPENKAEQQPIIIQNIINNQPNMATSAPPTVSHHQLCSPKDKSMALILFSACSVLIASMQVKQVWVSSTSSQADFSA